MSEILAQVVWDDPDSRADHGVVGMKWGIRRYQNKDGSRTAYGVQRAQKSMDKYESDKAKLKSAKAGYKNGTVSRHEVRVAKQNLKTSKKKLNENYDRMKRDHLADKGKDAYQEGKRIGQNREIEAGLSKVGVLAQMGGSYLAANGNSANAKMIGKLLIGAGTTAEAASGALFIKDALTTDRYLRAHYGYRKGD